MFTEWLMQFKQYNTFNLLDIHLAAFLTQKVPFDEELNKKRFCFLVLSLSMEVRAGHVCLDITRLNRHSIEPHIWLELAKPSFADWQNVIKLAQQHQTIGDANESISPLILSNNKLYFQRMWSDEKQIANYFSHNAVLPLQVKSTLEQLFTEANGTAINWQKVAVAVALTRKVAIISGGPGTGKTTTVAKILAGILLTQPLTRTISAAPTGKAASRLSESLSRAITELKFESLNINPQAMTLHRLLGAKADSRTFTYHKNNPLNIDVLVIDEASMVDLNMMARVIEALPASARLILLGDKDQLSSVEAGAIFGDLCDFITDGYSHKRAEELSFLTGYHIPHHNNNITIADSICLLQKSYRFSKSSGIGLLANAVKQGNTKAVINLFSQSQFTDIKHHALLSAADYQSVVLNSVEHYQNYLTSLNSNSHHNAAEILKKFSQYRLLCAVREGLFGVDILNKEIESLLIKKNLVKIKTNDSWYIGRPVMILKNSATLGLYNGDIGITMTASDASDKLRVYFAFPDGSIKGFSPFRLPEHETAYVMTVHKSQGSEFDFVNIILPTEHSPLLTRSLLYTAITRAKQKVMLYASDAILTKTVKTQTERRSDLVALLNNNHY